MTLDQIFALEAENNKQKLEATLSKARYETQQQTIRLGIQVIEAFYVRPAIASLLTK